MEIPSNQLDPSDQVLYQLPDASASSIPGRHGAEIVKERMVQGVR
jgi:hypothetical protein